MWKITLITTAMLFSFVANAQAVRVRFKDKEEYTRRVTSNNPPKCIFSNHSFGADDVGIRSGTFRPDPSNKKQMKFKVKKLTQVFTEKVYYEYTTYREQDDEGYTMGWIETPFKDGRKIIAEIRDKEIINCTALDPNREPQLLCKDEYDYEGALRTDCDYSETMLSTEYACFKGPASKVVLFDLGDREGEQYRVMTRGIVDDNEIFFEIHNRHQSTVKKITAKRCKPFKISFIFAIRGSDDDGYTVFINPKGYWEENGILADSYSDDEYHILTPILKAANLKESAESMYAYQGKLTMKQLKTRLISLGTEYDKSFQRFIGR